MVLGLIEGPSLPSQLRRFMNCCCIDRDNEVHQMVFAPPTESSIAPGDLPLFGWPSKQHVEWPPSDAASNPATPLAAQQPAAASGGPLGDLGEARMRMRQARVSEKARLQEMVQEFTRRAVVGESCDLVDPATGVLSVARFRLEGLERLVVSYATTEETCELRDIVELLGVETDGEQLFPRHVLEAAGHDGLARLCGVRHAHGCFYILLRTEEARTTFHTCMRVLKLYVLQDASSGSGRGLKV